MRKPRILIVEDEESTAQEPYPNYGEGDDDETILGQDIVNSCIEKSAQARGQQTNVSFFAFQILAECIS